MRVSLDSIDDPRLAPYRDLPAARRDRSCGRFIAESEHVVRRLLASPLEVESVLATPAAAARLDEVVPSATPLYVATSEALGGLVGYRFHAGVLACGVRRADARVPRDAVRDGGAGVIVALSEVVDPRNVGSVVRSAAAFGARAVLLDGRCADAFSRQAIRVSVGHVFSVPIVECRDLAAELGALRETGAWTLHAAVTDPDATPLRRVEPTRRDVLLLGGEGYGLPDDLVRLCDRRVGIPMHGEVDSLNVAVAAAILMYHLAGAAP